MTNEVFWDIVAEANALSHGAMAGRAEALALLLSKLSPDEIVQFQQIFQQQVNLAYTWDLWGAAYIIGGGCSDDGFTDFRSWLISLGKERFMQALQDPESLTEIEFGPDAEEDAFFEEYAYIAAEVYKQLTGNEMPYPEIDYLQEPTGEPFDEDGDDLARRFPKLWEKNTEE